MSASQTTETPAADVPAASSTVAAAEPAPAISSAETATAPAATGAGTTDDAPAPVTDGATTDAAAAAAAPAATALPDEEDVSKTEVKIKAQPVAAGTLGYKAPGLIKSLRFSPRYFWFDDAAAEEKSLSTYLKTEKAEVAHPHAAHASQTGKGLLFFAKREDDKPSPSGILNLTDATDLAKEGNNDFSFKISGHKHTFQAANNADRDGWIVAVQKAIDEGKPLKDSIVNSEGYKNSLAQYGKPAATGGAAAAGAAAAAKSTATPKAGDKTPEAVAAAPTAESSSKVEATKTDRSRSQSRKRASVFGKVWQRKEEHEEKKEAKKEEKEEVKAEKAEEKKIEKEEKKAEKEERKVEKTEEQQAKKEEKEAQKEQGKLDEASAVAAPAAAVAATSATAPGAREDESEATSPTAEPAPTKSKRTSIFGGLGVFGKKDKEKETAVTKKDETATSSPKETEPVAQTAPQLAPVETDTQKEETATSPTNATASAGAGAGAGADAADTTASPATDASPAAASSTAAAAPKSDKPESKGGLFGFRGKKDNTAEAKKVEVKEATETPKTVESPTETPETTTATPVATTGGSPTANEVPKERRRSSFFGGLSVKKDKKPAEARDKKQEVTSESEATDNERKSSKLQGLFRRASKSPRPAKGPATDIGAPPAPPAKDSRPEAAAETSQATTESPEGAHAVSAADDAPVTAVDAPKAVDSAEATGASETPTLTETGNTAAASEPVAASA